MLLNGLHINKRYKSFYSFLVKTLERNIKIYDVKVNPSRDEHAILDRNLIIMRQLHDNEAFNFF